MRLPHRLQGQKVKSQGGAGAYCGGHLAAQLVDTVIDTDPGVLLVNPVRPCLKINDIPVGWEYFTQRGWDVIEVPPPVTVSGWFCQVFVLLIIF